MDVYIIDLVYARVVFMYASNTIGKINTIQPHGRVQNEAFSKSGAIVSEGEKGCVFFMATRSFGCIKCPTYGGEDFMLDAHLRPTILSNYGLCTRELKK